MVHMVDALDLRVALQGHRVKAHRAQLFKRGFQAAQCFHRGAGLDEFIFRQNHLAQLVFDRHDRAIEVTRRTRGRSALLRLDREGVHIVTREAAHGGDQVSANALRHKQRGAVGLGVLRPGTAVRANRHAAHALNAARNDQVFPAAAHFHGGHVDGL